MSDAQHRQSLRVPLIGAGILVGFVLAITTIAQWTGAGKWRADVGAAEETLTLAFADRDDGAVIVTDAASGEEIYVYAPEKHGFVRGALRAVAHKRKMAGLDTSAPFEIARHVDGKLSITDPLTGARVILNGFGAPNAAEFAHLFEGQAG
ncbi:MAG: photosynthetic complex assembly protein PuhC [Parvularculaceae bacterium]|nr:photosynthetic complex assembly protein PuhC [Parvularculaceae bacterium]